MDEPNVWRLHDSRVDYYAATTSDPEIGRWAYERARDYVENERLGNTRGSGASEQGYVGVSSERSFAGERDDGTYIRLSSDAASDYWAEFCGAGLRTSRIDVEVTCICSRDVPTLAYAMRYGERLPARIRGRLPGRTLISKEEAGDTCYVGGPESDRRGRVYDKARESKGAYPLGAWRFEVQLRHGPGHTVACALARRERVEGWIQTYVHDWFRDRGLVTPIPPVDEAWRGSFRREPTTDEGRINYLKTAIAPMLVKLQPRHTKQELRRILGLQFDPKAEHGGKNDW